MPEELADNRQAADKRDIVDGRLLIGDDDAANHNRLTIVDENAGVLRLGIESRDTLNPWNRRINLRVLNMDVHKDRAVLGDLRRDLEFKHGVNELDGNCVID